MLGHPFLDEAKSSTFINSYSVSIRDNYFTGIKNVFCLGDPRMDEYSNSLKRKINYEVPTITIGASGYSPIDLNSYLAIEFDFLYDVLTALSNNTFNDLDFRILIKVRSNGYANTYRAFVDKYFPGLPVEIIDKVPIQNVLVQSDLYISIYSQSLFEASCIGVPVIYHKKDCEILNPPFDGNSELVTTYNIDDLITALRHFRNRSPRFDLFMNRSIMEKYIGPLDGCNLDRNFDFVTNLIRYNKLSIPQENA